MVNVYVIEEGTMNHIPRPLFSGGWHETNNLTIPPYGSGTVHLDTETAPNGIPTTMRWELQAGPNSGTSARFLLNDTTVSGLSDGAWTGSVWARTSNPNLIPMIYVDVNGINGGITGTMITPVDSLPTGVEAGEWFRIIGTKDDWREQQGAPIRASFYLGVYPTLEGRNQTGTIEFAGPQFEPKPYATPFAHGDMGEGYSWTGTPHNSISIREPSSISMPSPEPESLYVRYSEDGEIWDNEYVSFENKPEDIEPTLDLGQHSNIRYVDNKLKLLTDKKLYIGIVIGFSRPLSQKEIEILDSTPLEYISGKTLLNLPETTVGVSQLL